MFAKFNNSPLPNAGTSLTTVFDGLRDGIVTLSADNAVVETANSAALSMFGLTANEMRGTAFRCYVPDPTALVDARGSDGEIGVSPVQTVGRRGDGSEFPMELYTTWTPTATRAVFTVVMRNRSSEHSNQEPARPRDERQSQEERKLKALGRFANEISHDFNNLLVSIIGNAGFLRDDLPIGSREHSYAKHVIAAGKRGLSLVDRLLAFSRKPTGDRERINLIRVVSDALNLIQRSLPKNIALIRPDDRHPVFIFGNEGELIQALVNICSHTANALRDRPGRITVTLDTRTKIDEVSPTGSRLDPSGAEGRLQANYPAMADAYAIITVTGARTGIETGLLADNPEPLFTTKHSDPGTGFGLSAVQSIVAAHGGSLIISTSPSFGTRIELAFPMGTASADAHDDRGNTAGEHVSLPGARVASGNGSILVVDDEPEVADVIVELLDRLGFDAVACNESETAVGAVVESPGAWRAVLIDQAMPGKSGLEIVSEIRQAGITTPVIMVSGNFPEAGQQKLASLGIVECIQKPIRSADLADLINRAAPAN
jgi:PAS domain S-box-containing protein